MEQRPRFRAYVENGHGGAHDIIGLEDLGPIVAAHLINKEKIELLVVRIKEPKHD